VILERNIKLIDEVNSHETTFKLGINKFADMTEEEKDTILSYGRGKDLMAISKANRDTNTLENRGGRDSGSSSLSAIDWVKQGNVAPVRN